MAAATAILGKGATIAHSTTLGGSYTPIGEVFEMPFPEFEAPDVETTHYTSPNDTEEYLVGWNVGNDMEISMNYTPAVYAVLLFLRRQNRFFKITLISGATLTFQANVKKVGGAIPNKDRVTNNLTMKPTTDVTYSPTGT